MPTYVHTCPAHGRFEERRSILRADERALCPTCGAACGKAVCFDPKTQLHLPNKFRTNFETTGMKGSYGGGDWENHVSDYHRWDSDFAGPIPGNDLPAEMR